MNNPKVSVIIPVYNTEAYVEQTLRSIMGQTLRDIELIVVNDGSTDGSLSVLERIATGDDRIRLYTQPNKGLSQTRNAGIARARGEFIYFMDSDDLLEPDALERCYERCQSDRLDFVFFDAESFGTTASDAAWFDYRRAKYFGTEVCDGTALLRRMLALHCYRASACLSFIRTAYLRGLGLRFYPGILHEDEHFTSGRRVQVESNARSSSGAYTGIRSWDAGFRAVTSKATLPSCGNSTALPRRATPASGNSYARSRGRYCAP